MYLLVLSLAAGALVIVPESVGAAEELSKDAPGGRRLFVFAARCGVHAEEMLCSLDPGEGSVAVENE